MGVQLFFWLSKINAYCKRLEEYYAPNDEAENDRLDMHHHLATLLLGKKLHVAPIDSKPQRILDVGCGTGIWSIDMGKWRHRVFTMPVL